MKDVKPIIAENLVFLRKSRGITQAQLAEKLDYSDKAISRWEHGDTLPDMNVLCELCDYYEVTLDYLVHKGDEQSKEQYKANKDIGNKIAMCSLVVSIVWLAATLIFVYSKLMVDANYWKAFIWAVPVSFGVISRMCRNWAPKVFTLIMNSLLVWTLIASIYIQLLQYNLWLIFIIGVPAQITLIMWFDLKSRKR